MDYFINYHLDAVKGQLSIFCMKYELTELFSGIRAVVMYVEKPRKSNTTSLECRDVSN